MAATLERKAEAGAGAIGGAPRKSPWRWAVGVFAIVALAAVGVAAVAVFTPGTSTRTQVPVSGGSSLYTAEEKVVMSLVNQGLLPKETLEAEPYRTKRLVNQGLIPRAAAEPWIAPVEPLYTARERTIMQLVNQGLIPKETLDGEPFRTKRLINQGLIPREAAYSAADG